MQGTCCLTVPVARLLAGAELENLRQLVSLVLASPRQDPGLPVALDGCCSLYCGLDAWCPPQYFQRSRLQLGHQGSLSLQALQLLLLLTAVEEPLPESALRSSSKLVFQGPR